MARIRVIPARDEANIEQKVVTFLLAAVQEKPDSIISVFAGTPAFGVYRLLVDRARAEVVDFSRVRFVVFDELLPAAAAQKMGDRGPFRVTLDERLFIPLGIPADNVICFSLAHDREAETTRVAGHLAVAGIDIALLSVDSRGHIGFHVNGSDLDSKAGIVRVENRERWGAVEAFSLGLADLAQASRILLFAAGRNLAEIVRRLTEGTFDPSVPISVLQHHEDVLLVADTGALSLVAREERIHGFYSGFLIMDARSAPTGRRILVVSPHPDDAPISLGGTMAMLSQANTVTTAIMTTGHRSFIYGTQRAERIAIREAEVQKESRFLGVEPRFLRLPFYDANYEIAERDLEIFGALLATLTPELDLHASPEGQPPRAYRHARRREGGAEAPSRRHRLVHRMLAV